MGLHQLDAEKILRSSASEAGLVQYIDEGIRARFSYVINLLNEFGSLTDEEYPPALHQLKSMVKQRLLVARDWALHPEILDEEITQPFFVIGNARAGTTFTQMLLTWDEGHRTPLYRDVRHPSPPRGLDPAADAAALEEENNYVRSMVERSPQMMSAHPYLDQGGNGEAEDEDVYSLDFNMVYPLQLLNVATMPQALVPPDPLQALKFHKNMLKQFQWKTPTRRWVGKGVLHQYVIPTLLQVYPDAVCFWTHRAPEEFIASLLALLEIQYKPFNGGRYSVQPQEMAEQLKAGIDYFLKSEATYDSRIHHIRFRDLVKDPIAVIAPIYEKAGIPFTKKYEQTLRDRLASSDYRANRYGKFDYTLEKYGLNREVLRKQFSEYCDRFEL
ncbi:MAG: hypothetical protein JWM78_997 [Verrucomicrobiaceae bacterium]|nr:hypothetical protein [Verrucomicrobiaceae bacterium]